MKLLRAGLLVSALMASTQMAEAQFYQRAFEDEGGDAAYPPARAQRPVRIAAAPQSGPYGGQYDSGGQYGGGFIEFLMTGREPAPRPQPAPRAAYPGERRAPYGRYAALPQAEPRTMVKEIDPMFLRQEVAYSGPHKPGTIIIDTPQRFLFLVQPGGRALRYGIGVGRPGFEWAGMKTITRKAEWPSWTPPAEMLKRRPDLPRFMTGGPENPLGARAMYLGSTLYRIHGTNEPFTIGEAVSSGCIRMTNEDVIDLYGRVQVGAKVLVI